MGKRQFFFCRDCKKTFSGSKFLYKTYGPKIIVNAVTYYNLGNSLKESAKLINKRFKVKVSKSSISYWLKEIKGFASYSKIRNKIPKNYRKKVLFNKVFEHNNLNYNFRYHKIKSKIFFKKFPSLISYIKKFEEGCPRFFDKIESRCSQEKIKIYFNKKWKVPQTSDTVYA